MIHLMKSNLKIKRKAGFRSDMINIVTSLWFISNVKMKD